MKKENIDFESAMLRIQEIVKQMEKNEIQIDYSMDLFEEGIKLSKFCKNYLNSADLKVKKLIKDNGSLNAIDFDNESIG